MPPIDPAVDVRGMRVAELRGLLNAYSIAVPSGARKSDLLEAFDAYVRPRLAQAEKHAVEPSAPTSARKRARSSRGTPRSEQSKGEGSQTSKRETLHDASGPSPSRSEPRGARDTAHPASPSVARTPPIHFAENPFQSAQSPRRSDEHAAAPSQSNALKSFPRTPGTPKARRVRIDTPTLAPQGSLEETSLEGHTHKGLKSAAKHAAPATAADASPPAVRPAPSTSIPAVLQPTVTWKQIAANWRTTALRWMLWAMGFAWLYYCHRTREQGFCAPGTDPTQRASLCTPCPAHGICRDGQLTHCASADYVLEEPGVVHVPLLPYALPHAWTAQRCVPDTYRLVLAAELADAMVDYLAHWRGQVQCGYAPAHPGAPPEPLGRYALPAARIRAVLAERVDESIDAATYAAVWAMATDGLQTHAPKALARLGGREPWYASYRAAMPLRCRMRLYVVQWLWRHLRPVLALLALSGLTTYVYRRIRHARERRALVARLAGEILARLQEQAARSAHTHEPREMPAAHVRDWVLASEPNPHTRKQLWVHVATVVEQNANVRTRQAQWEGEWLRVWEWVGVVPSADAAAPRAASPAGAPDL